MTLIVLTPGDPRLMDACLRCGDSLSGIQEAS